MARNYRSLGWVAFGAQSFENIVYAMNFEVAGQRNHRNMDAAQAVGAVAAFAVKMCVQVVEMLAVLAAVASGVAHGIFQ